MTLTSTKSWKHYMLLCRTLERNDISFRRSDRGLNVRCSISGQGRELVFLFVIDPEKMLVSLYSPVLDIDRGKKPGDIALQICMINNSLSNGSFCIDRDCSSIYFKMTTSFYETNLSGEIFEYMLSQAADTVEEYHQAISKAAER